MGRNPRDDDEKEKVLMTVYIMTSFLNLEKILKPYLFLHLFFLLGWHRSDLKKQDRGRGVGLSLRDVMRSADNITVRVGLPSYKLPVVCRKRRSEGEGDQTDKNFRKQ